jgi:hypothetical protein
MKPFIPLNTTNEGNVKNLPMSGMTEDGIPVCQAGHQMYYCGYSKDRDRLKWRCPIKANKNSNLKCDFFLTHVHPLAMVESFTHIQQIIHVYIPLLPEEHRNGKTYMTTGRQQRGFSSERRTTLTFALLRLEVRNVFFSMLY